MATAIQAVEEIVPGTVAYELTAIRKVAKGGKQMPRAEFAEAIGVTASQIQGAEKGRKIKTEVWEKIVTAYPALAQYADNNPSSQQTPSEQPQQPVGPATIESSTDEQQRGLVDLTQRYIDDPHPLPGDNTSEVVILDIQPSTQEEQEENPDDEESSEPATNSIVGSHARYEQQHNEQRTSQPDARLFSNSEIQAFKRCRRKWYLAWYRKLLLSKKEIIGARSSGTRVHYALEHYYVPEGETPTDPRKALNEIIAEDREILIEQYGTTPNDVPEDVKNKFNSSSELERAMIEGYMEWLEESGADQGLKVIAPEKYVEAPLAVDGASQPVKIIGKLDVQVQRETDGAKLFIDHKTRQNLDTSTLHMDEQMLHYHLIEWLSGDVNERVDGVLFNMLRKVKRTASANPPFYGREEKKYNWLELDSYKGQVIGVIKDILRVSQRLEMQNSPLDQIIYPNKQSDCSWSCDFFPVCPMFDDGSRGEDMLEEYYRVGDPLEYYDDKHIKVSG